MRFRLPESIWPSSLDARPFASTAAANGALAVVGLLTGMLAARLLGAEGRGQLAAAQAWPLFLATLGSFGLTEAIAYFVARSPSRARAALATGLLLAVPVHPRRGRGRRVAAPAMLRGQTTEVQQVATLCLVLVPLLTLSAAPSQALRGVGRYRAWNVLRLVTPLAWLATLVAVQGTDYATVPTLALAFIGATALAGLVTHVMPGGRLLVRRPRAQPRPPDAGLQCADDGGHDSALAEPEARSADRDRAARRARPRALRGRCRLERRRTSAGRGRRAQRRARARRREGHLAAGAPRLPGGRRGRDRHVGAAAGGDADTAPVDLRRRVPGRRYRWRSSWCWPAPSRPSMPSAPSACAASAALARFCSPSASGLPSRPSPFRFWC